MSLEHFIELKGNTPKIIGTWQKDVGTILKESPLAKSGKYQDKY